MVITTSDLKGAEFEGKVFLTFNGWWGTSSETKVLPPTKGARMHKFKRCTSESFTLMSDDVGPVSSVTVRYEPVAGSNDAWSFSKLVVNADAWWGGDFNFDGWLTEQSPSCTVYKHREVIEYCIVALTSKVGYATARVGFGVAYRVGVGCGVLLCIHMSYTRLPSLMLCCLWPDNLGHSR